MTSSDDQPAARRRLRAAGLRVTPARVAVLAWLAARKRPCTHAEIHEGLAAHALERATLYRVLVDLVDAELIRRTEVGDRVFRFEHAYGDAGGRHPHFVCSACRSIRCLPVDAVALTDGTALSADVEINMVGRCTSCTPAPRT